MEIGFADDFGMAKIRGTVVAAGMSGSAGPVVFVPQPGGGTAIRQRTTSRNPRSAQQVLWRDLISRAGALWRTLTPEQAMVWREYAEAIAAGHSDWSLTVGTGQRPNASGAFIGLTAKLLQVDPAANPPLTPPSQDFLGDGIGLSVSAGSGSVVFTASGPNSTGVVTELLLQPLPSRLSTPQSGKDRHQAFRSFAPGSLVHSVPARPGAYAASVRFVRSGTGQASSLVRVGLVVVLLP